ncbi:MAG: NAD-dependent dehydratase [Candidatus Omnitrophota bacterium]|nr:MAG: NAD-dependent dehydratase [Candidatus Omnitrophota bacterium]
MGSKVKHRVIVTGGAGFIGSYLTQSLLREDREVLVLDNFSTGRSQNLQHLKALKNLSVINADVADFKQVKKYFKNVNWVFHLAGIADIIPSINNPLLYHHANVDGTVSILEASRLAGVERFIYAASSSCYGIPGRFPTSEEAPIAPRHPYALTKYMGEVAVLNWGSIYKLPVISLRLFNVYGTRSRTSGTYGAVFGVFLAQKLNKKPFTVVGDGNQTRDFTFVTDVARAFISAAESNCKQEVFNVGSGNTYSINRLAQLLGGEVAYIPKRPGEPDCTHADISKIKKVLGWQPKVSLEEGVKIILENIDYWKEAPVWTPEKIETATKDWFQYLKE